MKKFLLSTALVAASAGLVSAADMPMPVKAPVLSFSYPMTNGWIVGIGTEGGGGQANVTVPGLNPAEVTTNQIGVHGLVGYVWNPNSVMFASCQARVGIQNFNGSVPGFSFTGPLALEQRCEVGAPTQLLMSALPSLFSNVTPAPFVAPTGQTIQWTKGYVGFSVDEWDASLSFGDTANHVWQVAPGVVVGFKNLLSGGTVADTYAKVRFDNQGACVGNLMGQACGRVGTTFLAGVDFEWGVGF